MKNFYYDLKEYATAYNTEVSEETLFLFINNSIKNNLKLKDYIKYILSLDSSLEVDDICSDCYVRSLKLYNKFNNLNVYNLINILRDIITYNSVMKRKHYHEEINEDILNVEDSNTTDLNNKIIIEDCLNHLKNEDEKIEKCIRMYFLEEKSYRNIAKEVKIGFRTVKNKIDKGLELIKKYKGLD